MNYLYWQEISYYLNELDKEKAAFDKADCTADLIEATRKTMSAQLENLRASLEKMLDKHHTSLILFAIVAALDEKMQGSDFHNTNKLRWIPIQKDLYSAYTAGEVFYKSVDEILESKDTPSIVYQVYYSMLKRGFLGKYQESKTQINKYMEMLRDKIPTHTNAPPKTNDESLPAVEKGMFKTRHYYGLAGCLFVVIFIALFVTSNLP